MDPILEQYTALEKKVESYYPALDKQLLFDAFTFADKAHSNQLRKDGSPYITHPLAVAQLTADLELDQDSVMAALLHDTIEDTGVTHEEVAHRFGETVADLVEGVTKLTRVHYTSREEKQMENLRKMLLAMSKDIRVVLVKICDRMHNMRTMQYQTPKKQREKALETMEIYAPLAHRLGMQRMKWELEDLSLKYLDPVGYNDIKNQLDARFAVHQEFMSSIQSKLQKRLDQEGIHCTIYGRIKHIYSIYRKMYTQHKTLYEIFDLYAFRVIVDDIVDCYNVLGHVHDMFNLVPDRFKDYISTPKPNMYQSLHTTLIGKEGIPFEVQIRTWEMHQVAEYGIAAHWKYKSGMGNQKINSEATYEWVRKLLESQQDTDAEEFVKSLKVDLFADEVFVFTPQGDVVNLPAGATPIDFAYSIHSAIGNRMVGAKVNHRIVPYDTHLHNGDIVEIITSNASKGPSRDWINLCASNEARNKIRQWFKKERRDENIATGRASFESEMRRNGLTVSQITEPDVLPQILKKVKFGSLDDLYAAIGYGGTTAAKAVIRIKDELARLSRHTKDQAAQLELLAQGDRMHVPAAPDAPPANQPKTTQTKNGIIVEGLDNFLVKFAKCCSPVPGDPIVGFITRGYGISIHRQDCPNAAIARRTPEEAGRWIKVSWGDTSSESYETSLDVTAKDRDNLLLDVAAALSGAQVRVVNMSARSTPDGFAVITAVLQVRSQSEVNAVMRKLNGISGVMTVGRSRG